MTPDDRIRLLLHDMNNAVHRVAVHAYLLVADLPEGEGRDSAAEIERRVESFSRISRQLVAEIAAAHTFIASTTPPPSQDRSGSTQ